jgi:DNA primase
MVNHLLVNLVDNVLGKGKPTSGTNYAYHCPFCHHRKLKLEVNFRENSEGLNEWHCWTCNARGTKIINLFKQVNAPTYRIDELKSYVKVVTQQEYKDKKEVLALPKDYKPLYQADTNNVTVRQALRYLKERNITSLDIARYNLGYCEKGSYANMVIVPSYDELGNLNYFVARNFGGGDLKYKNPKVSKNIVAFEMMVNWESPIIICEGSFDAMAIKRNAVPLLGKIIPEKLMKKIVSSKVQQVFIALDKDAIKDAVKHCEKLLNHGKEVFMVNMNEKDPSELGFEEFTKLLHEAKPLNFGDLLLLKLQI